MSKMLDKVPDRATETGEKTAIPNLDNATKSTDKRLESQLPVETGILLKLGTAEYNAGNLRKAREYWVRALDQASKSGDTYRAMTLSANLGLVNYFIGDLKAAEGYLDLAESLTSQLNVWHTENEAHMLSRKALVLSARGKHTESICLHERARVIYETAGLHGLVAEQYANIGRAYFARKEYRTALDNTMQAIEIAERAGYEVSVASSYINIGLIHCELGNDEEAEAAVARAEPAIKTAGDSDLSAHLYSLRGRVAKLKGRYPESIAHFQNSLALFRKIGSDEKIAEQLGNIGWSYKLMGEMGQARDYLEQAHTLFQKTGFVDGLGIIVSLLADIEATDGYPTDQTGNQMDTNK